MGGTNAKDSSPIGAGKGDGIVEEQDEESANAFACNFSTLTSTIGSLMLVNRLVYTKISQDSTVWVRLSRNMCVSFSSSKLVTIGGAAPSPPKSSRGWTFWETAALLHQLSASSILILTQAGPEARPLNPVRDSCG